MTHHIAPPLLKLTAVLCLSGWLVTALWCGGLSQVGYQIGMHSEMSDATRLLFATTGILLRRLTTNAAQTVAE